jgi:two-component system sensor histidine kinase YesM
MLIIGIYMSVVMYSKSFQATYEKMQIYTDKTVENIEQSLSFVSNTTLAVATSQSILNWINNLAVFDENSPDYFKELYELKNELQHILTYSSAWKNNYISYIAIFKNDKLLMYTYSKPMPKSEIVNSSNRAYKYVMENEGKFVRYIQPFVNDNKIYHVRIMKHDYTKDDSLAIMISIDEKALREHYNVSLNVDQMVTYLVDKDGYIFSSSREEMRGKKCDPAILRILETGETDLMVGNEKYICLHKKIGDNGITFVNLVPREYVMQQALVGVPTLILVSVFMCAALLVLGAVVSFRSTAFIRDLAYGMEQVKKKNYDVKMPHYNNYAVDYLSNSFNSMTEAMKVLVKDTYESKIMRQEMQLEFLQQQINPHFLFNILLTIQIKAKMCSDETVYNMLASLSGFLRAGLYSNKNTFTTLGEELQCARFYLYLQQQRFDGKLQYEINVPQQLMDIQIPRLTIEPIIENAIVHGVENFENMVTVKLQASDCGDDMEIVISDDGAGFYVESLNLDSESVEENQTRDKIGLKNTNNRLKILYGKEYTLHIESQVGNGTIVTVRIPKSRNRR